MVVKVEVSYSGTSHHFQESLFNSQNFQDFDQSFFAAFQYRGSKIATARPSVSSLFASTYPGRSSSVGDESGGDDPDKKSGPKPTNLPSDSKLSETRASKTSTDRSVSSSSASSEASSESQTSNSGCPLTSYTFSLTPGTDLTTLDTGSSTVTGSVSSAATSNSTNATTVLSSSVSATGCPLTSYTFSLTPGTDLKTLDTGSGSGSATDSLTSSSNFTTGSALPSNHTGTTSASKTDRSLPTSRASKTTLTPDCMADGAPWYSPTSWCDCATSGTNLAFPTLPPSSGTTGSSANCAYTYLDPSQTIKPVSVSAAPTNIPGMNGVPGCAYVMQGDGQGCPNVDYCNCGGTYVGFLTTTVSGTMSRNCDVKFPCILRKPCCEILI